MPVAEDGTVHFTTTLFALIRESLMIKTGPGISNIVNAPSLIEFYFQFCVRSVLFCCNLLGEIAFFFFFSDSWQHCFKPFYFVILNFVLVSSCV